MYPSGMPQAAGKPLAHKRQLHDGAAEGTQQDATEGSSLAYRIASGGEPSRWLLYTDEVRLERGQVVEGVAARLGFDISPIVEMRH